VWLRASSDPHPERPAVWRRGPHGLLGCDGCRNRVLGSEERRQKSVPLGVEFLSVSLSERLTEEALVFRQDLRIPVVTEALEECGRPLDVSEEEGDRRRRPGSTPGNFSNVGARGARRA
jgi:hypothetical protein